MSTSHDGAAELYCPHCERSLRGDLAVCPDDGTALVRLSEAQDPFIGTTLDGRFVIEERLGGGGMGSVYRAVQTSVEREVAIKIIRPELTGEVRLVKRFLREAKLASRLEHPNIIAVYDFGQTSDGTLFLAMELVPGQTLAEALQASGPFDSARIVDLGSQLLDALGEAHARGIVHRDLKPVNIMLTGTRDDRELLKVLDFGIAKAIEHDGTKLTDTGLIVGTPAYIPPEILQGGEMDHRGDLYSVGVVLYQMAAGEVPFKAANLGGLLKMQAHDDPPELPETVPPVLRNVITRLLDKEPSRRYASAAQTREALLATAERPVDLPPDPAPAVTIRDDTLTRPAVRRSLLAAASLVVVAAATLALSSALTSNPAPGPKPESISASPPADTVVETPPAEAPPPEASEPAVESVDEVARTQAIVIVLDSEPWSEVWVNGRPFGRTPVRYAAKTPGQKLRVSFQRRGYTTAVHTLRAKRSRRLSVNLEPTFLTE